MVYTTIALHDAGRTLEQTQVSFDRVIFRTPPKLKSKRVEIVITNGEKEFRSFADILPPEIPICSINRSI